MGIIFQQTRDYEYEKWLDSLNAQSVIFRRHAINIRQGLTVQGKQPEPRPLMQHNDGRVGEFVYQWPDLHGVQVKVNGIFETWTTGSYSMVGS